MFEDFYSYVMNDRAKNTFNPSDFVHMFYLVVVDDTKPLKDNICLTPKDSKFFPDMAIVFQSLEQRTKYLNDQLAPPTKESYFVEMFGWSRGVSSLAPLPKNYWDRHKMINLDLGLEVGPINFVIEISKKQHNSTSVKTDNNHGIVMGYNQRVPEYKASFVMTEREQEYYKVNKKEVPTFLGIELEYIIKKNKFSNNVPIKIPEQERQALLSPTVKSIADSGFGDHCIMKFDRSVFEKDPTGFEIVTVPATLEYHKKMFDEHFFIKDKRDSKYKPRFPVAVSNACGFHVHIGKDAFLPAGKSEKDRQNKHSATFRLRLGKFIAFMSSPDNLQFIIDLSGRPPNKYCEPNPVKDKNKFGVHNGIGSAKRMTPTSGYDGFARRSIVNTLNSETIEIRIFDATVERNQLFRRLEFCHALVEFVKVCSPKELTVYHFVKFLCDEKLNNKKYETLLHWLSTKKMVGVEKKVSKKHKKSIKVYGPCLVTPPKEVAKDTKGYIERWTNKTNPSAELEEYSRLVRERLRTTINA